MLSGKKTDKSMDENNVITFNAVYIQHSIVLRKLAVNYGVQYRDVEDVIQDTFLAFYTHYSLEMEAKEMRALLSRILKNRCIDYLRRNSKVGLDLGIDMMDEKSGMLNSLSVRDTLTIVLEREEYARFWNALKCMRSDWRDVFYMYFFQGYPMKDVGAILGISEEACRTRISRGRKYLKVAMGKM